MTKALTDKTYILVLYGGYKIWLNEIQADLIKKLIEANRQFISFEKYFFKSDQIRFIMPAADVERDEHIKNGEWQCGHGTWHARYEDCGHTEQKKYGAYRANS